MFGPFSKVVAIFPQYDFGAMMIAIMLRIKIVLLQM